MPLRRVQVTCSGQALPEPLVELTDGDGHYEFSRLPAGRYSLTAARAGYTRTSFRSNPRDPRRGTPIDLQEGEVFDAADFALAPGGVITGRVTDEYGDPLIDITVTAGILAMPEEHARFAGIATALTDDEGRYRLWGLAKGAYYVLAKTSQRKLMASATDVQSSPTFYPGVGGISGARAVEVEPGEETEDVDFIAGAFRLSKVSGAVVDSVGRPASNAKLVITGVDQEGASRIVLDRLVVVGPSASFVIPNLPPGDYEVIATLRRPRPGADEVAAIRFSMDGQDVSGLVVALARGARMFGTLSSSQDGKLPIPSKTLRVAAVPMATRDPPSAGPMAGEHFGTVGPDGSFEVAILPGRRLIRILGLPPGWALLSILHGSRELLGVPIELATGTDLRGLRVIVTNRLAELQGQVIDESGRPLTTARVVIFTKNESLWTAGPASVRTELINHQGRFQASALRPGDYLVAPLDDTVDDPLAALKDLRRQAVPVVLSPDAPATVTLVVAASDRAVR